MNAVFQPWPFVDAVQSRLLFVCDPVPDVRCRSGIFISLGRHRTGRRYRRIDQHFVFMVILILGLAYAWRKGALEWK